MKSLLELIGNEMEIFKKDLNELLLKYTSIGSAWNRPGSNIQSYSPYGDRSFNLLESKEKTVLQNKLYNDFNRNFELWDYLIEALPPETVRDYKECKKTISNYILQSYATWSTNTNEAVIDCEKQLREIYNYFDSIYTVNFNQTVLVLDTSAILANPNIEKWKYSDMKSFALLIPSTVISELDSFELSNKNDEVKKKARAFINMFKDYAKRGRLTDGVTILKNKISLRSMPFEPDPPKIFSQNFYNNDDKVFSAFLNAIRSNIHSSVILVSRDAGLHAKANHYGLPVIDPPAVTKIK